VIRNFMQKGFTLIELLTTMSVIAIISAVVFADFSGSEKRLALKRSAYQVAQDLRETEEMALASVSGADCGGGRSVCGFGLEFNAVQFPNSYLIFTDCSNDCASSNYQYDINDKSIKRIYLEKNIQIQGLSPSPLDIVFTAPDPVVWINKNNWGSEGIITLKTPQNETRVVRVNSVGMVAVE